MAAMKLTSLFLGDEERKSLALLARDSGKSKSECLRMAIREAARVLTEKMRRREEFGWDEDEIIERAARPKAKSGKSRSLR